MFLNKKAQFELDIYAVAFGLIGGIVSLIVMSQVQVGLIWKILSFILTSIVCYFVVNFQRNR